MLLLFIASIVNTLLLTSINLIECSKEPPPQQARKDKPKPKPLPPPPPNIELAGSGAKDDHTLKDVASLSPDEDSIKNKKKPSGSRE
ncbi:unnamed protein product [Cylicocyclus nassatus]|uniref:Uncharacterized protein n=1 Tax=Cylicocyclus nassatus TaxID=53992 RepID=A0AA36M4A2_CYLNA|nr:unnamed protein product [Cylicocyclus nassatus]